MNYIALNYPTNDIEIAIKEAEEQIERESKERIKREKAEIREKERLGRKRREKERKEIERREKERLERERKERERKERIEKEKREAKGIYVDKSLDLLRGCSTGVIRIIYDEFHVSNIRYKPEKLDYIALNYPTKDIEKVIEEAEDYIIEKALYQHNYTKKSHKTIVNAIKSGKTRQEAADIAGVSLNDITWWYNHGKQGESPYDSFYEDYTFARKIVQLKKGMKNEGIASEEIDNIVNGWIKAGCIDNEILRMERERKERIERERLERERKEREAKGIYVEKSLDLLNKCSSDILQIVFHKFHVHKPEKVKYTALNYPTKDIEKAIKEAKNQKIRERKERIERERKERFLRGRKERERLTKKKRERERKERETKEKERKEKERLAKEKRERERKERERKEREEKGIYVETSLDLLRGCNAGILRIIYNKFTVSDIRYKPEKLNYIAMNYPTNDIRNAIKEAEDQIERENAERERKGIYLDKSLNLLRGCSVEVLEIIYDKFSVSPYIQNKSEKLNYIAMNYSTKVIERAIKKAEKQIKRPWNKTKKESKTKDKIERERLEREKRRVKNEDGATLVFTIVGGGGFIVSLIFMLLIGDAVNHNYEGILFLGWIISLIVLFIIFVILYRENNRMIDEIYDN